MVEYLECVQMDMRAGIGWRSLARSELWHQIIIIIIIIIIIFLDHILPSQKLIGSYHVFF